MTTLTALKRVGARQRHFIVTRKLDSPTAFFEKYRPKWWALKEAMEDGKITVHNINGRNNIETVETLLYFWPDATSETVEPVVEVKKNDLFS
jgi:hypothetical protein